MQSVSAIVSTVIILISLASSVAIYYSTVYSTIDARSDLDKAIDFANRRVTAVAIQQGDTLFWGVRNNADKPIYIDSVYVDTVSGRRYRVYSGLPLDPGEFYVSTYTIPRVGLGSDVARYMYVSVRDGYTATVPVRTFSGSSYRIEITDPRTQRFSVGIPELGLYRDIAFTGRFFSVLSFYEKDPFFSDVYVSETPISELYTAGSKIGEAVLLEKKGGSAGSGSFSRTVVVGWYGRHGMSQPVDQPAPAKTGSIYLQAGRKYVIEVRMQDAWGYDGITAFYKSPRDRSWRYIGDDLRRVGDIVSKSLTAYVWDFRIAGFYADNTAEFDSVLASNPRVVWGPGDFRSINYPEYEERRRWCSWWGCWEYIIVRNTPFPWERYRDDLFLAVFRIEFIPRISGEWWFGINSDDAGEIVVYSGGIGESSVSSYLYVAPEYMSFWRLEGVYAGGDLFSISSSAERLELVGCVGFVFEAVAPLSMDVSIEPIYDVAIAQSSKYRAVKYIARGLTDTFDPLDVASTITSYGLRDRISVEKGGVFYIVDAVCIKIESWKRGDKRISTAGGSEMDPDSYTIYINDRSVAWWLKLYIAQFRGAPVSVYYGYMPFPTVDIYPNVRKELIYDILR